MCCHISATSNGTFCWILMWFGASVAGGVAGGEDAPSLSKVSLPSGFG